MNLHPFAPVKGVGAGIGVHAPDEAVQDGSVLCPVDMAHVLCHFFRIGGFVMVLGNRMGELLRQVIHDGNELFCPQYAQGIKQFPRRHMGRNVHFFHRYDIARIHAFVQLHDGDAGFLLPVDNGPLDGSGTAILRQQGGMDVDGAVGGNVQYRLRQDFAIGDDDDEIRFQVPEFLLLLLRFQGGGLEHGDIIGQAEGFHRGKVDFLSPAVDPVRLGIKGQGHVAVGFEGFQGGQGEIGGTHENDAVVILHFSVLCAGKSLFQ